MSALLALLLAFPPGPGVSQGPSSQRRIDQILRELDGMAAASQDRHPLEVREAEKRMRALLPEIKAMGPEAVAALGATLANPEKPLKSRLYAAAFLGMHGDPGAFKPLRDCALDVFDNAGLRSTALQALSTVRVGPAPRRKVLEAALENEAAPPAVRTEALEQLADLGTGEPGIVLAAGVGRELKPQDRRNAVRALAKSKASGAAPALLDLLPLLDGDADAEVEALAAFLERPKPAATLKQREHLIKLLRRRRGKPAAFAARTLGRVMSDEAADELRRSLRGAKDPLVVTESAEALARYRDPKGTREILALSEGLFKDRRFSSFEGEDVSSLAERVHAAAEEAKLPPPPVARSKDAAAEAAPPPGERKGGLEVLVEEDFRRGDFRFDGFPGDSRPRVQWPGGKAVLYDKPEPGADTRKVRLPAGDLDWDASVVWTLEEGLATVLRKLELEVRDLGAFNGRYSGAPGKPRRIKLAADTQLGLLGVKAGGDCFVRWGRRLIVMECPQFYPGPYEIERLPVVEWWVRVEGGWMTTAYEAGR